MPGGGAPKGFSCYPGFIPEEFNLEKAIRKGIKRASFQDLLKTIFPANKLILFSANTLLFMKLLQYNDWISRNLYQLTFNTLKIMILFIISTDLKKINLTV